ncbi:hypothetical protein JD969_12315 [Planctomycetota bacterium]|nr:hypothetical protein JD969_12315 [Planctomycetota bacterium]
MSNDQQTYKRAANAALFGMVAQILLSMVLVIIGLVYDSLAIDATIWYMIGGVPIWFVLWTLFNAHKQERVEALEAEQLAEADAEAAALFNEAGQQLHVARKRLEGIYKYWLNGVSVFMSLYLLTMGTLWFYKAYSLIGTVEATGETDWKRLLFASISDNAKPLVLLFLLIGIAFLGFIASRYVAGMTKVKEWQPLRGGASYMIGNVAVILLLLFAGTLPVLMTNGDYKWGFVGLSLAVPVIMLLLGSEIILSFVFGMYRPRKAGEVVRPSFDSRILGWLTRPESISKIVGETLNYQFGFEISRSWFMELLNKSLPKLIVVGVVLLMGLSCLTIVEPQQQAVILRNGDITGYVGSGFHFKYPWPVGSAEKYDVDRIKRIAVGSSEGEGQPDPFDPIRLVMNNEIRQKLDLYRYDHTPDVLWTNAHSRGAENYMVIAPTSETGHGDGEVVGTSVAGELVGIDMIVDFRIKDLEKYVTTFEYPERMLRNVAVERLSDYIADKNIDKLVGEGRAYGAAELKKLIQHDVDNVVVNDKIGLGLEIVFVGFSSIHPPQGGDVAKAFHEQNGAMQDKQIAIQNAEKDAIQSLSMVAGTQGKALNISKAIETLDSLKTEDEADIAQQWAKIESLMDSAGGQAAQLLQGARAYRWERALQEQAQSRSFEAQLAAYRNAPDYYKQRMYWNMLAESLKDRKKIVIESDNIEETIIRMDLKDASSFTNLMSTE